MSHIKRPPFFAIIVVMLGWPSSGHAQVFQPYGAYASSALRLDVTPKQAQVYVDGYYEGIVDDFDGSFQKLRLASGAHEVTLYLDGYRTVRQTVNLTPNSTYKVRYKMERLAPGEIAAPRPEVANPPQPPQMPQAPRGGAPMGRGMPPIRGPQGRYPPPGGPPSSYGTLTIRVQPANAAVLIDGERWEGPEGQERLAVEVAAGRHHVEIQKDGYQPFNADVEVRPGDTTPLNVSLRAR